MDSYSYEVSSGHGLRHNPLKAIIAPRPIGWISTLSVDGIANLAPYSFFNLLNDEPPLLMFSSTGYKDSVRNAEATGEFVVNMASVSLAEAMNQTSAMIDAVADEFLLAGLAKAPCLLVKPPRVAQSPAALECRVVDVRELVGLNGKAAGGWMTVGEIVAVHVDTACIIEGTFRTELAQPIQRAGYAADYWAVGSGGKFAMRRPSTTPSDSRDTCSTEQPGLVNRREPR